MDNIMDFTKPMLQKDLEYFFNALRCKQQVFMSKPFDDVDEQSYTKLLKDVGRDGLWQWLKKQHRTLPHQVISLVITAIARLEQDPNAPDIAFELVRYARNVHPLFKSVELAKWPPRCHEMLMAVEEQRSLTLATQEQRVNKHSPQRCAL